MTIFNWTISAAERAVSLDGLQDVIQTIHWRYKGTDENGIIAETYGVTESNCFINKSSDDNWAFV